MPVLLRSIFRMGVPVTGKSLFPSNIAGLPTWFTIRVSKHGWTARKNDTDILISMNPERAQEDVLALAPGAVVIFDEPLKLDELRSDVIFYSVPCDRLAAATGAEPKLRKLVRNMVYVGVAAQLLSIDMELLESTVRKMFSRKAKAAELNLSAVRAGYEYAKATLTKQDPFVVERMNANQGKILIDGNSSAALGAMFAGVTVVAWYPITPSTSTVEDLIDYMKQYRVEKDGKASFAIVQAEDELAAIGMVMGAGWAGARAMTATSGPGISLMAEICRPRLLRGDSRVIFDIQRVGPSTGLPTRTSQGDLSFIAGLSHGDTKHVMLLPASVKECFELSHRGLRSGRAVADAGLRHQRPRPGHEQLDVGSLRVSGEADRIAARCSARAVRSAGRLCALQGRGWRRHRLPHPARNRPSRGGILHARLRPQRKGPLLRASRGLREQYAAPGAQVRDGEDDGSQACPRRHRQAEDRNHRIRHQPLGGGGGPRPARARERASDRLPAHPGLSNTR